MNPFVAIGLGLAVLVSLALLAAVIVLEVTTPPLPDPEEDEQMTQLEPAPVGGKPAVQSVTYWGLAGSALGLILPPLLAHFHILGDASDQVVQGAQEVLAGLGLVVAGLGRRNASQPVTSLVKPKEP